MIGKFFGMKFMVDPTLPPDKVELRGDRGTVEIDLSKGEFQIYGSDERMLIEELKRPPVDEPPRAFTCQKCEGTEIRMKYGTYTKARHKYEWLNVTCLRCDFMWKERPSELPPPPEPALPPEDVA